MAYFAKLRQQREPGSSLFVGDRAAGKGRLRYGNVDVEAVGRMDDGSVVVDQPMPAEPLPSFGRPVQIDAMPAMSALGPGEWAAEVPEEILQRRRAEAERDAAAARGEWFRPRQGGAPAGQGAPAPAEAAGRAGLPAGVDLDGDGIPDGAEVTRTIRTQGEDGSEDRTVLKWVHQAAKRARGGEFTTGEMSGPEAQMVRRGLSVMNRDTGRRRAAEGAVGRQMRALDRLDRLNEAEAGRGTAETVEGIRGGATIGGERERAAGHVGAAREMAQGNERAAQTTAAGRVLEAQTNQAGEFLRRPAAPRLGVTTTPTGAEVFTFGNTAGVVPREKAQPGPQGLEDMDAEALMKLYKAFGQGNDATTRMLMAQLGVPEEPSDQGNAMMRARLEDVMRRRGILSREGVAPTGGRGAGGITPEQARAELERRRKAGGR